MKTSILPFLLVLGMSFPLLSGCDKNNNVNFMSIEDDKELGQQLDQQIEEDPENQYPPILKRSEFPKAYSHLDRITNNILNSGELTHRDEFVWEIHILHDDETKNAFAAPGGYIYVYTGLIKFLESEDDFAGVMAHEVAHADLRHSSRNITRQNGLQAVLKAIAGNDPGLVTKIGAQLLTLKHSRNFESEADAQSVEYLDPTVYRCDAAAGFFEKLEATGQGASVPQFLSTHPSPDNRIEDIGERASEEGCSTSPSDNAGSWQEFQNSLP